MLSAAAICGLLLALMPAARQAPTGHEAPGVTGSSLKPPFIRRCRSVNQETFTCWWSIDGDGQSCSANYTLTYTVGFGQPQECPDYTTAGDGSCFFDSRHTEVWEPYCLNVTAHSPCGSATSEEFCLDVIDIVEPDPPLNLSGQIVTRENAAFVQINWNPPVSADVESGWISLVYQLNFRPSALQEDWKIRGPLTEPQFQLHDLAPGESYLFQVRCKPVRSGRWSNWSEVIELGIPAALTKDANLLLMLLAVIAFLFIGLSFLFLGERIKRFFLPPIPVPHINGIDTALLKKGHFEEIDKILMKPPLPYHKTHSGEDLSSDTIQLVMDTSSSLLGSETSEEMEEDYILPEIPGMQLSSVNESTGKETPLVQLCVGIKDRSGSSQWDIICSDPTQRRVGDNRVNPAILSTEEYCAVHRVEPAAHNSPSSEKSYMHVADIGDRGAVKLKSYNLKVDYLLTPLSCQGTDRSQNWEGLHVNKVRGIQDTGPESIVTRFVDCSKISDIHSYSRSTNDIWSTTVTEMKPLTIGILDYVSVQHLVFEPNSIAAVKRIAPKVVQEYVVA
ncbi:prolactin receptor-like [Lissotriton helveticus]